MNKILVISLFFSSIVFAGESKQVEKLILPLEDNGYVTITVEECKLPEAVKMGLTHRAIGLEGNGQTHEGCWNSPNIAEAEQQPGMRVIPIVNLYFDGMVQTVPLSWFQLPPSPDNPAPGETWI